MRCGRPGGGVGTSSMPISNPTLSKSSIGATKFINDPKELLPLVACVVFRPERGAGLWMPCRTRRDEVEVEVEDLRSWLALMAIELAKPRKGLLELAPRAPSGGL